MEIKIIDLPKITDPRGNLTFAEAQTMVPFDIKRAYWVYDVPGGESRGGHAHKQLKQFVIALSGSFHVTLDDGHKKAQTFAIRLLGHHNHHTYMGMPAPYGLAPNKV